MNQPLKISENNAPLSCKQHDENIDALLDRRNHTNQIEDCEASINQESLDFCVGRLNSVENIKTKVDDLNTKYDILNQSVEPNGQIENTINNIEKSLNDKIVGINSALITIATDLELMDENKTDVTEIYTLDVLNQKANSNTDPRALSRFTLEETKGELNSFISANKPILDQNKIDINNLINPTTGTFTLLKNYVDTDVEFAINKVPELENSTESNNNEIRLLKELTGPLDLDSSGNVELPQNKTLQQNVTTNFNKSVNNANAIKDVKDLIGNPNNLRSSFQTVIGDTHLNRQAIEAEELRINRLNNVTIPDIENSIEDVEDIANGAKDLSEKLDSYFKITRVPDTDRTIRVEDGRYTGFLGNRLYFRAQEVNVPLDSTSYIYIKEDTNSVVFSHFPQEEAVFVGTVTTDSTKIITGPYPSQHQAPSYISRPGSIRKIGGVNTEDYIVSGTNEVLTGQQFYKNFTVPAGTILTIEGGAHIYVTNVVNIEGKIIVKPIAKGGSGYYVHVDGGFVGRNKGFGLSEVNTIYHWSTFFGGTGGSSGITGSNNKMRVRIPKGGEGGGGLRIISGRNITVKGTIEANGTDGTNGVIDNPADNGGVSGSGGGAGGAIVLEATRLITISPTARMTANGGDGGNSRGQQGYIVNGGGGGGGGWITLHANAVDLNPSATLECKGGAAGKNDKGYYSIQNPAQGGGLGGAFGGLGGNGSAFTSSERTAQDNPVEIIRKPANY